MNNTTSSYNNNNNNNNDTNNNNNKSINRLNTSKSSAIDTLPLLNNTIASCNIHNNNKNNKSNTTTATNNNNNNNTNMNTGRGANIRPSSNNNNSNNTKRQKVIECTSTQRINKGLAIQYGQTKPNKKHKKETLTDYVNPRKQSDANDQTDCNNVNINVNINVNTDTDIDKNNKIKNNHNGNNNDSNVNNYVNIGTNNHGNNQNVHNNNEGDNDDRDNNNNNNNNTRIRVNNNIDNLDDKSNNSHINNSFNEKSNIINNTNLSPLTDHQEIACHTKYQKKAMKSHNKTINKHTRTRSENNASIKNYFQSASSKVIDHTTYSQTYLKSFNKNSSLLSMNVSSEIKNPLPAINVLQPNDSEPLVQSQLQPLPDTAISRKRSRSPDPPPSSPILASKRRPIGHCSPGTAEGPSGQG